MPFRSLRGNDRLKKLLQQAVVEGRIGHGLIFGGRRGVGKYRFAIALAQALNCDSPVTGDACGECLPCRKIFSGEHPDVQTICPDGAFIKIDQMRVMSHEAQFRPFEGRRRVVIIDEADRLREGAANSILKTLEEPPDTSSIVLVTARPYSLLETIRSRCQMLNFAPLSLAELERLLKASGNSPSTEQALRARLAQGSVGRALEIDLENYRSQREVMLEIVESTAASRETAKMMAACDYLGRKIERPEFEAHLEVLTMLLRDLLRLKAGDPIESLINIDIASRLERLVPLLSFDRIIKLAEQIEEVSQSLIRNVNRQLAMEAILVSF